MKINNITVSVSEFYNGLNTIKYILHNNEQGIKTTWPRITCDGWDVYLNYDVDTENNLGYKEETRLRDNMSITCGYGNGCFWTSYLEK